MEKYSGEGVPRAGRGGKTDEGESPKGGLVADASAVPAENPVDFSHGSTSIRKLCGMYNATVICTIDNQLVCYGSEKERYCTVFDIISHKEMQISEYFEKYTNREITIKKNKIMDNNKKQKKVRITGGRIFEGFAFLPEIGLSWIHRYDGNRYYRVQFVWLFWYISIGRDIDEIFNN